MKYIITTILLVLVAGFVLNLRQSIDLSSLKLNAKILQIPRELADVELKISDTESLNARKWSPKWKLVYFGFLTCPDICPTTISYLAKEYELMFENKEDVEIWFVSLDPKRDTFTKMKRYTGVFHPKFRYATSDFESLKKLTASMATSFSHTPVKDSKMSYLVEHSGDVFILSPKNEWVGYYRPPLLVGNVSDDMRNIVIRGF